MTEVARNSWNFHKPNQVLQLDIHSQIVQNNLLLSKFEISFSCLPISLRSLLFVKFMILEKDSCVVVGYSGFSGEINYFRPAR